MGTILHKFRVTYSSVSWSVFTILNPMLAKQCLVSAYSFKIKVNIFSDTLIQLIGDNLTQILGYMLICQLERIHHFESDAGEAMSRQCIYSFTIKVNDYRIL